MSKKDMESLNKDVLGDLSIEELEQRLELQILHPPETQDCYDCDSHTKCDSFEREVIADEPGGGAD